MSMISILKPLLEDKYGRGVELQLDDRRIAICSQEIPEEWNDLKEIRLDKHYINLLSQEDGCSLYKINGSNDGPFWVDVYLETKDKIWFISIITNR